MTTQIRSIRDLIFPLLEQGTNMREMIAMACHYVSIKSDAETIRRSLAELRDMGYVVVSDGERWWLEQGGDAA